MVFDKPLAVSEDGPPALERVSGGRRYRRRLAPLLATADPLLGDFTWPRALHDAFTAAVNTGHVTRTANPRAWLDFDRALQDRRPASGAPGSTHLGRACPADWTENDDPAPDEESVEDDRLRLIFNLLPSACRPTRRSR